jgi:hypothetical protein
MSITQDGETFSGYHGKMQTSMPEPRVQRTSFPGISGESHIISKVGTREIWTSYTVTDFSTALLLDSHITAINQLVGTLTGTVTVGSPFGGVFGKCTFMGFEVSAQFYTPNRGWTAQGRLVWIQRDPVG